MKLKLPITIFLLQNSSTAINLATQIILTAILPLNTFGSFAKVFVLRDILVSFLSFSIGMSVIQNRTTDKVALIATTSYLAFFQALIILIIGSLISLILYFFNFLSIRELLILLFLLGISLFNMFYSVFYSFLERDEKFIFNSQINLAVTIISVTAVITTAFFLKNEAPLILREFLPNFLLAIIYVYLIVKLYGLKSLHRSGIKKEIIKDMINYSFKMYFSRLSEALLFRLDLLIISRLFDSSLVGLYERAKYFATLPWNIIISYIHRIHFVKYVKSLDPKLFKRTNYYAILMNISLFLLLIILIYLFSKYNSSNKWGQLLLLIPFFAGYSIGAIVENYKTFFYAKGEVIYAMLVLRMLPVLVLCFLVIITYFISNQAISIYLIAFYTSIAYISPLILYRQMNRKILV